MSQSVEEYILQRELSGEEMSSSIHSTVSEVESINPRPVCTGHSLATVRLLSHLRDGRSVLALLMISTTTTIAVHFL